LRLRGVTLWRTAGALECIRGAERMDGAADRMDGAARKDGAECPMERPIETPPPPPPPRPLCWASALVATTDAVTRHSAPIRRLFVNIR